MMTQLDLHSGRRDLEILGKKRSFNFIHLEGAVDGTNSEEFLKFMEERTGKRKYFLDCSMLRNLNWRGVELLLKISDLYRERYSESLTVVGLKQCFIDELMMKERETELRLFPSQEAMVAHIEQALEQADHSQPMTIMQKQFK